MATHIMSAMLIFVVWMEQYGINWEDSQGSFFLVDR